MRRASSVESWTLTGDGGKPVPVDAERITARVLEDADIAAALVGSDDPVARALAGRADVPSDLRGAATIDAALARPDVIGGTAPRRVADELAAAARRLGLD